jgi:hypothetical protein
MEIRKSPPNLSSYTYTYVIPSERSDQRTVDLGHINYDSVGMRIHSSLVNVVLHD